MIKALLLLLFLLAILPVRAGEYIEREMDLESIDHEIETLYPVMDPGNAQCLDDFEERRIKLKRRSIINPFIGLVAVPVGTVATSYAGSFIGEFVTGGSAWGGLVGGAWGTLLGASGAVLFIAGREYVMVKQYIDAVRAIGLIKESYSLDGQKFTQLLQKKLSKKGLNASVPELKDLIRSLDKNTDLCDGKISGKKKKHRKLTSIRKLVKYIVKHKGDL